MNWNMLPMDQQTFTIESEPHKGKAFSAMMDAMDAAPKSGHVYTHILATAKGFQTLIEAAGGSNGTNPAGLNYRGLPVVLSPNLMVPLKLWPPKGMKLP